MKQITGEQFQQAIQLDPAWASKLTEPVEITTYANLQGSNITHLSPLLTFSGRDKQEDAASFSGCKNLKIATGKFAGTIYFSESGIEKIQNLEVTQPNKDGWAAHFYECQNLKVATGKFAGCVYFSRSGIAKIQNLEITQPNKDGEAASFNGCQNLKIATGKFPGWVSFSESGIEKIKDLHITQPDKWKNAADYSHCPNLKTFRGTYNGKVHLEDTPIQKGPSWLLNPNKATIDPQTKKRLGKLFQKPLALEI